MPNEYKFLQEITTASAILRKRFQLSSGRLYESE